ncbi:kinase-like domain-containing protein [Schizophyllum commune]
MTPAPVPSDVAQPVRRPPPELNPLRTREAGCGGLTTDKKYFTLVGQDGITRFLKRSLTEAEWAIRASDKSVIPASCDVRAHIRNEAAATAYVRANTNVPVPNVVCCFEDGGRTYLLEDEVPGVTMAELPDEAKPVVIAELEGHLRTIHALKGTAMGGFCGDACLPYRLAQALPKGEKLVCKPEVPYELVLCHNDLSQHNVIVDPETLKVNAIIDWEFSGFYPQEFEGGFYKRPGPSGALKKYNEVSDVPRLLQIVEECKGNVSHDPDEAVHPAAKTMPVPASSDLPRQTFLELNPLRVRDPGCTYITCDRKYYELVGQDGVERFMKRSLTEAEWAIRARDGARIPPAYDVAAHIRNEAAAIAFVRAHTNIPVPNVICSFDDGGRSYLIEDKVPGISMSKLPDDAKVTVMREVEAHIRTLQSVKGTTMGGFCGVACLPFRVSCIFPRGETPQVTFRPDVPYELVLCHNDMAQHNIIVDPETLKINAIIDWEFAGFYPKEFEAAFYKRSGGSVALKEYEEVSDLPALLEILETCASEESKGFSHKADPELVTKVR